MELYQHFRKEEHAFVDQVLSWQEEVERFYESRLSDFLDPREQDILASLIGKHHDTVKYHLYGTVDWAERKRAIIAPFYEEPETDDFQIAILEASYPEKFVEISHRDVMGAFLSLGIKRKKLGDIVAESGVIQIAVAREIASYVTANLTGIKHAKISLHEIPPEQFRLKQVAWKAFTLTVSSLRLDAVLSEVYKLSRKNAQEAIAKGIVKVNYRTVDDGKFQLQDGDLLSFRGKGRSKLISIDGQTKKEKLRITAAVLE